MPALLRWEGVHGGGKPDDSGGGDRGQEGLRGRPWRLRLSWQDGARVVLRVPLARLMHFLCLWHDPHYKGFSKRTLMCWGNAGKPVWPRCRVRGTGGRSSPAGVVGWCPGRAMNRATECSGETCADPGPRTSVGCLRSSGLPCLLGPRVHFQCLGAAVWGQAGAPAGLRTAGGRCRPSGKQGPALLLLPASQFPDCPSVFPLGLYTDPSLAWVCLVGVSVPNCRSLECWQWWPCLWRKWVKAGGSRRCRPFGAEVCIRDSCGVKVNEPWDREASFKCVPRAGTHFLGVLPGVWAAGSWRPDPGESEGP